MIAFWARRPAALTLAGIAAAILIAIALSALLWFLPIDSFWFVQALAMPVLAATALTTKFVDRMPLAWSGIGIDRWTPRHVGIGLATGAGAALIGWLPTAMFGVVKGADPTETNFAWTMAGYLLAAALTEELVFRGYLYQRLIELAGATDLAAVSISVVFSVLFAAAHVMNPSVTPLAYLNLFLGGILFCVAFLRTGSVWTAYAAHIGWNLVLAMGVGAPVSGISFGAAPLVSIPNGPVWLDGGQFGPEGGLAGTLGLALGVLALLKLPAADLSPYVHARVFKAVLAKQAEPDPPGM